jgi:hypothetical protein
MEETSVQSKRAGMDIISVKLTVMRGCRAYTGEKIALSTLPLAIRREHPSAGLVEKDHIKGLFFIALLHPR